VHQLDIKVVKTNHFKAVQTDQKLSFLSTWHDGFVGYFIKTASSQSALFLIVSKISRLTGKIYWAQNEFHPSLELLFDSYFPSIHNSNEITVEKCAVKHVGLHVNR